MPNLISQQCSHIQTTYGHHKRAYNLNYLHPQVTESCWITFRRFAGELPTFSVPILNASTNFPHVKYGEFSVPAVVFSVPIIPLFLMGTVSVMLGGINTTGWGSLKWYNVWQGVATKKTSCPFPPRAINNNRSLIQSLFNALHGYSFSLSGFRNLAENARCLVPPCCFSSSRSASFLSPENIWRIHRFEFRNLTGTSQGGCRNLSLAFQREATQFLMAKNFTVNNLQACHLPLTLWRTWC